VERASISRDEESTVELGESLLPTIFHMHRMACVLLLRTHIDTDTLVSDCPDLPHRFKSCLHVITRSTKVK
jgi:hypothetical protein